ncbi:MAG: phosphopantetheine-binding protein [Lachnospira sp.]|nr:phosphopantetheine-binding protein [Lachnospira sp.]
MLDRLAEIIMNYVEVNREDIKPESRFMEDLGFTSFDFMSMLGEVEEEFDVEIVQEDAADIRTVQEAIDYLEKLSQ